MARSVWKGPFVDGYLLRKAEKARAGGRSDDHQDLEPALDDPAAVRRPDLRRLQRPQAHPGAGQRGHGRPQVRRVLADADLPRPYRRRQEGEEGLTMSKPKRERRAQGQRGAGACTQHDPHLAAEAQSRRPADPRQEGGDGARRPHLLPQAHRARRQEDAASRRSPMPRTITSSTSTRWSSPRPMSASRWC